MAEYSVVRTPDWDVALFVCTVSKQFVTSQAAYFATGSRGASVKVYPEGDAQQEGFLIDIPPFLQSGQVYVCMEEIEWERL